MHAYRLNLLILLLLLNTSAYASGSPILIWDALSQLIGLVVGAFFIVSRKSTTKKRFFAIAVFFMQFYIFYLLWHLPGRYSWEYPGLTFSIPLLVSIVCDIVIFKILHINAKKSG